MSTIPLGIFASSGGTAPIAATVLIVDGGSNTTRTLTNTWYADDAWSCSVRTATYVSGAPGGSFGTRSLTILPGTSYAVTVGAAGGGQSSFASLRPNTNIVTPPLTNTIWTALGSYYVYPCGAETYWGQANGGSGGPSASSSWSQPQGQTGSLTDFSSIGDFSSGGGGRTINDAYLGNFIASSYGLYGKGKTDGGSASTAGVVVIRYPESSPLPASGTYTASTVNGFRQIVCSASTTLTWA